MAGRGAETSTRPTAAGGAGGRLRRAFFQIHLWAGLITALPMIVVAVTGAFLVYGEEIDQAMRPDLFRVTPGPERLGTQALFERLQAAYPSERFVGCSPPPRADQSFQCYTQSRLYIHADPYTGRVLGAQHLEEGLRRKMFLIHSRLMAGTVGHTIVVVSTIVSVALIATGLVLWWKYRIFGVRLRANRWRLNFDLHNALGFWSAAVFLVLSVTGVVIAYSSFFYPAILRLSGSPPPAPNPVSKGAPRTAPSLDDVIAAAERVLPGARVTLVGLPAKPTDVYSVYVRHPEDPAAYGRSRVRLDRYSLEVLATKDTRKGNWGSYLVDVTEAIHFGDIFGEPSRIVAFLVSLFVGGQVLTGVLIWWKKV